MSWLSGYTTRRRITISNANIDAALTNFPVYVRLRSANFNFAQSTATGNDIRFTAADGVTLLSFERERHDQGASLADYMVRIPTVSNAAATEFFIYFSTDTAIANGATPTAVWDSHTMARYALSENPAGTAPQMRDSTVNARHGTTSGAMTSGQSIEGQVGRALNFDGVDDRVEFPGGLSPQFTVSGKVRLPNFAAKMQNTFYDITPHNVLIISLNRITTNGNINVFIGNGTTWHGVPSIVSSVNLTQNVWHHLAVACNGTSTILYLDGVNRGSSAHIPSGWGTWWRMGDLAHATVRESLAGHLDEFVISNVARSSAWVKASFHSGADTLLTVGAVEYTHVGLAAVLSIPSHARFDSLSINGLVPVRAVVAASHLQTIVYATLTGINIIARAEKISEYDYLGKALITVEPSITISTGTQNLFEHLGTLFVSTHPSTLRQITVSPPAQTLVQPALSHSQIITYAVDGLTLARVTPFALFIAVPGLQAGDLKFAGRLASDYNVRLLKSPVSILPGTRDKVITIPGRQGSLRMMPDLTERTITLECWLAASSIAELYERLDVVRAWLTPLSGAQQLILGSTPDRHYLATYSGSGLDAEIIARQGLFSVAFVCPDPFAYAINPDVVMITASPHTHTQRGTAPAEPLLRLQGASTGAGGQQISITVGGQTVTYRGVLAAGDWLEIDSRDMTAVRVVGASRVNALPGFDPISIFPVLTPGTNIVVVSVAGGATWSLLEMYCRNRWL